ncbi:MAG: hypothetical protein GVY36_20095, partial [Verrucomicrobia bacterium]|nr:hypothetical protein [Verrucomicrobiota bacterium]
MKAIRLLLSMGMALGGGTAFADPFPINTPTSGNWATPVHSNGELPISGPQLEQPAGEPEFLSAAPAQPAGQLNLQTAGFSSFAADFSSYSPDIQNIVRATDGDIYKIYDLIRNHVEFQPYFGFRKSPEVTWQSRRGNDADQAFLLVECLRAAGFDADFQYGVLILSDADALDWFGAENITGLNSITGSAGYFGGSGPGIYGIEQIWCSVVVDDSRIPLAPAYKTYAEVAGIDLAAAMNYTQAGLLSAGGGTETATYVQGVSEEDVNSYLAGRAMDLVSELRTNHPTAEMDEVISGRRMIETHLESDFSNGFYSEGAFVSAGFDTFIFDDPYGDYYFNGSDYSFYAYLSLAIGEVNSTGDAFVAAPLTTGGPTGLFSGKKLSVTFDDQDRAELRVDDVIVNSETALPNGNAIGWGYLIEHPYDRSAGTLFDELRVRPIERGNFYVYAFDTGGAGKPVFSQRRRQLLESYMRDGLTTTDPEVATEALYLLGLNWTRQNDLSVQMLAEHREFVPVLHHIMALIKQESGFSVDIPATLTAVPKDGNTTDPGRNLRAILMMGSAMEHGVIEQSYADFRAVSTVRYLCENNLAGGKTFLATSANYSTVQSDADFVAGWSSAFRNSLFPSELSSGFDLVIPEDGAILMDSLTGNGYFRYNDTQTAAIINPGSLKGGFATTPGFIDFGENSFPVDPTLGPDNRENPLSFEPIDMLTGAYVYDGVDLSLSGEGVRGLTFSRHYSSLASANNKAMGKGWSHNHESSIIEHSDIEAAFGEATPVHAASLIAATWAVGDMVDMPSSPKAWVIGSLAAYWGMEEVRENTATIAVGRRAMPFTKLADGSFLPPAGMMGILTQDGVTGEYSLEERLDVVADFNADNKLASVTDADGNQLIYSYFTSGANQGKLQTVTDHYNRTLTFTYTDELLSQVADSTGRDVDFAYTGQLLTGVTDPEDYTATYAYDSDDRIQTIYNKRGEIIAENTYDAYGQVTSQVAEDDSAQTWEYAFTGVLNAEINPDREFLTYQFDSKGRTVQTIDGAGGVTSTEYDGQNQILQITDPRDNITRFEYDARNNLRFTYDARNGPSGTTYKVERQYDASDRLTKLIDEEGNETVFDYDPEHHLVKVTDPLLRETVYTYHSSGAHDGLLETVTTPGSTAAQTLVTTYAYDANGYPNSITRPDLSVLSQTFSARGDLLTSQVTTSGETNTYPVTHTYDLNRRLLTTTDTLGFGSVLTYDADGNALTSTDPFGNVTSSTYSPLARVESTTGPDGETIIFGNDISGRRSSLTNPLGQTTTLTYDDAGRLASTTNALDETVTQEYDSAGNRTGLINARGKTYQFAFTANN